MFKVLGNELFSFKSFEFSGITFSQRPFNTAPDKSFLKKKKKKIKIFESNQTTNTKIFYFENKI
jgi:hypothetical protein